jgi:hypothetical protein
MRPSALALSLALFTVAAAGPARAGWPTSPLTNLPVCTVTGSQDYPAIAPDGAGGALIAWSDSRSGTSADVYAQHVLASGLVDPAWPAGGRALCTAPGAQTGVQLVSDGAGGAIAVWQDLRGGTNYDIYAQRVRASGVVDPAWPVDGRALCTAANGQNGPVAAPDGAGGAIVAWYDGRGATANDIYAQHVLASGANDPAWPVDGAPVCVTTGTQSFPAIVSDGAGGAIVVWKDTRSGVSFDVYAQRVAPSGAPAPGWPVDGRALCAAAGTQDAPQLVGDGAGGAIVAWRDSRAGTTDIYAHHVLGSGVVDPAWPADGRALCAAAGSQSGPRLVGDGAGGAIVAWEDQRSGLTNDVYAHHVLASGQPDPLWPVDGRALCTAPNSQDYPMPVSDGAGGAIVVWSDYRGGSAYDVYAQHVTASGAVDAAWPADGRALCAAPNTQYIAVAVEDGLGGAIATWGDGRSGVDNDLYAQRVARFGVLGSPEPAIAGVRDVPNDQGGAVKLSWAASDLDLAGDPAVSAYDVLRSVPPLAAAERLARGARALALAAASGPLAAGDLVAVPAASGTTYWEYLDAVPALHYVAGYSYVAPTTSDSLPGSNPQTAFLVASRDANRTRYWPSAPASGYSVDNLAPAAPAPFTGQYASGGATLHWDPNAEPDFSAYRLYRGNSASFVPGPATLLAVLPDTGYADAAGRPYVYKLAAVDAHGNESAVATLVPAGALDAGGGAAPVTLSFAPPAPNPAAARAVLRFAVPRAGRVRLTVYDAAGRLVRELANGASEAGEYAEAWDLRDGAGRAAGAGLYFVRLESPDGTLVRRIAVAR